jgi:hypothetical protein
VPTVLPSGVRVIWSRPGNFSAQPYALPYSPTLSSSRPGMRFCIPEVNWAMSGALSADMVVLMLLR